MGFLDDIVRFFFPDKGVTQYNEQLDNAERLLRWGIDRNRQEDLVRCLESADLLDEAKADGPDKRFRKYVIQGNCLTVLTDMAQDRFEDQKAEMEGQANQVQEGLSQAGDQIARLEAQAQEMEEKGSLINAEQVRERVVELKRTKQSVVEDDGSFAEFMGAHEVAMREFVDRITHTREQAVAISELSPRFQEAQTSFIEKMDLVLQQVETWAHSWRLDDDNG